MTDWRRAACLRAPDPELFFPPEELTSFQKKEWYDTAREDYCDQCPIEAACLADAVQRNAEAGMWGGTTPTERKAMRSHHARQRGDPPRGNPNKLRHTTTADEAGNLDVQTRQSVTTLLQQGVGLVKTAQRTGVSQHVCRYIRNQRATHTHDLAGKTIPQKVAALDESVYADAVRCLNSGMSVEAIAQHTGVSRRMLTYIRDHDNDVDPTLCGKWHQATAAERVDVMDTATFRRVCELLRQGTSLWTTSRITGVGRKTCHHIREHRMQGTRVPS